MHLSPPLVAWDPLSLGDAIDLLGKNHREITMCVFAVFNWHLCFVGGKWWKPGCEADNFSRIIQFGGVFFHLLCMIAPVRNKESRSHRGFGLDADLSFSLSFYLPTKGDV